MGDLCHAITPDEYLEVGGGVLHPLSYQQARNHALPVRGMYVASPGYAFSRSEIPRGSVLTSIDGEPTPDLDATEAVLAGLPDGARVPVRYFRLNDSRNERILLLTMDRRWHSMRSRLAPRPCGTGLERAW